MGEPVVLSWGCQDGSGLSVRLVRRDDQLVITISAPLGLLDVEPFISPAEGDEPGAARAQAAR